MLCPPGGVAVPGHAPPPRRAVPARLPARQLGAVLAGVVAARPRGATRRRGRLHGTADWTVADVASWELHSAYHDPSDPRRGTVQLYLKDGCARLLHSEYGPVPVKLRVVANEAGSLELEMDREPGARISVDEAGLRLPDGTLATPVPLQPEPCAASTAFDADAYYNAASIIGEPCFPKADCERVILSRRLRKAAQQNDQLLESFVQQSPADVSVPADWKEVQRHKHLRVQSWLKTGGTWGDFDVQEAYKSWTASGGDSSLVPSVQDLRAHGYILRFFPTCVEHDLERERLLGILRQPQTALAQYLVQHHSFWQEPQHANRIDEIQEHFDGMERANFQREVGPGRLLAHLERQRASASIETESSERFSCLKWVVEQSIFQDGDFRVELILSPRELAQAADELKNCGRDYRQKADRGDCFLLVLTQGGKLKAMAEWDRKRGRFVQMVRHCNKPIGKKSKSKRVFNKAREFLPKLYSITITTGNRALTGAFLLPRSCSHPVLSEVTSYANKSTQLSLPLQSLLNIDVQDAESSPPAVRVLSKLSTALRKYKMDDLSTSKSLLDFAFVNGDKELLEGLLEIGCCGRAHHKVWRAVLKSGPDGRGPLHPAASKDRNGNLDIAEALVKSEADVNACDSDLNRPLHIAVQTGNLDIAEALVKAGADVNATGQDGKTALHIAVENCNLQIMEFLVKKGADVNVYDQSGSSPFHLAVVNHNLEMVQLLAEARADVNLYAHLSDGAPKRPLQIAAHEGNLELADLLVKAGAEVNSSGRDGKTALHIALVEGHLDMAELLVKAGADVNPSGQDGKTALRIAVKNCNLTITEFLVKKGADVNACDSDLNRPLHMAVQSGNLDIAEVLVKAGADVNASGQDGKTALHIAVENCNLEMMEFLVKKGADVDAFGGDLRTPLHIAVQSGHLHIAQVLVKAGADVNACNLGIARLLMNSGADVNAHDRNGTTPLHVAVRSGRLDVSKLLLEAGADVNAYEPGTGGQRVLHIAVRNGSLEMVRLLVAADAEVNATEPGRSGKMPLHVAVDTGSLEISKFLLESRADVSAPEPGQHGNRPLHIAVGHGNLEIAELLISSEADVNAKAANDPGQHGNMLHVAVANGNLKLVELLVKAGADVNARCWYKALRAVSLQGPLHVAARHGHLEIARFLLQSRADVAAADGEGATPLQAAGSVKWRDARKKRELMQLLEPGQEDETASEDRE